MMKSNLKMAWMLTAMGMMAVMIMAPSANAVTLPVAGSLGWAIYNAASNEILKGAIGFTLGLGCCVTGVLMAVAGKLVPGVGALLGGIGLINAEGLLTGAAGAIF
jgi:hypothetical protein